MGNPKLQNRKKVRQYNGKRTINDLQNTTQTTKDQAIRTPLTIRDDLRFTGSEQFMLQ